jgi:hypothetical protein
MVSAIMGKPKLAGFLTDRKEIRAMTVNWDLAALTDEQLTRRRLS